MAKLGDFLKTINQSKINLMDEDSLSEREYPAFVVNRTLSYFIDTIMFANEMNARAHLDSKMQYDYLLNSIRPAKRFSRWEKKAKSEDLDAIRTVFGYNMSRAEEVVHILSEDELAQIKASLEKGGPK